MIHPRPPDYIIDRTQRPGVTAAVLGWLVAVAIVFVVALVVCL